MRTPGPRSAWPGRADCGVALVLCLAFGSPAAAQERSPVDDLDDFLDDIFFVWSAPFNASGRDLGGVAVVGGMLGAGLLADGAVQRWVDAHPRSVPVRVAGPFREHSPLNHLGRTHFLLPLSGLAWLAGGAFENDGLRDAGLGCATSNVATTLSRATLSYVVGRLRPRGSESPYRFELFAFGGWDERSFPGGHAANIMSCVSFLSHRFELGAAEPVLYALPALIAFARTVDGAHWLSDTLFGMAWGFSIGKAVAGESRERENNREAGLRIQPYLQWSIRF